MPYAPAADYAPTRPYVYTETFPGYGAPHPRAYATFLPDFAIPQPRACPAPPPGYGYAPQPPAHPYADYSELAHALAGMLRGTSLAQPQRIHFHFKGNASEDAEDWILGFEIAADVADADEYERLRQVPSFLRDDAMRWWSNVTRSASFVRHHYTWADFREGLLAQFKHPSACLKARDDLANLTQTGSIQACTIEFRNLALRAGDCNDGELRHRYIAGLQPHLQRHLLRKRGQLNTLDAVINAATNEEAIQASAASGATAGTSRPTTDHGRHRCYDPRPDPRHDQHTFLPSTAAAIRTDPRAPVSTAATMGSAPPSRPPPPGDEPRFRRLTPEERDDPARRGVCFYCGEEGHQSLTCPKKVAVLRLNGPRP
eukprot:scaffold6.g2516.t1